MDKISQKYAKSLFQSFISQNKNEAQEILFECFEQLNLLATTIASSKKIYSFFANPLSSGPKKYEMLVSIFPNLNLYVLGLLKILAEKNELIKLVEISKQFEILINNFKNAKKAKLIISSTLEENLGKTLLEKLKKIINSDEIILNIEYNPKILGGLILECGSIAIDLSTLKQFQNIVNDI